MQDTNIQTAVRPAPHSTEEQARQKPSQKLRTRLLQITLGTMLLMSVATGLSLVWMNSLTEKERLADIMAQIRDGIRGKAQTLTRSHALALRGLVSDNAFSDVRELVLDAVKADSDVVFGAFVGGDGKPWAYSSPKLAEPSTDTTAELDIATELGISKQLLSSKSSTETERSMFGQNLLQITAPVLEDGEHLGTMVYGFSDARAQTALEAARVRSREALNTAMLATGGASLFSFLIGILLVVRASGRLTRPVVELTQAANKISQGERGVRVDITSGDEVETLANAFNQMQTAQEEALTALEETTERALAADRLKSEFLANMSHEIRTPMNGVLGMVKLMQGMGLEPQLYRYVSTIHASANALLTIINDILDFSKMEAGKYKLQSFTFDLQGIVQDVVELLAGQAHDKGVELIYRADPQIPALLEGDPDRLRQILNNLVGNAVKFTEKGEVFVDVSLLEQTDEHVVLRYSVRDTGIGIAAKDIPSLWDSFSQVDGSLARRHGGTGLGLTISKRLVEMMGGEINVESEPGKGSNFWFTARLALPEKITARNHAPISVKKQVLLLEPHATWRELIEEHLKAWGFGWTPVETIDAARKAMSDAKDVIFDAAILSADLDEGALVDLIRQLRPDPSLSRPSIIVLSTATRASLLPEQGLKSATRLNKPLRFSELYETLMEIRTFEKKRISSKPPLSSPPPATGKRILVVDDNEINRFVAVEELERRGYTAEEAVNGEDAVERFRNSAYACVLMDCQMPIMDGYTATRTIRKLENEEGRHRTPIIALTAHALVGERERVLDAGMDDFLSKPFRPSALQRLLTRHARHQPAPAAPKNGTSEALDPEASRSIKLLQLFLDRMPEQMALLGASVEAGNMSQARALAHKIKGSCLALAAPQMAKTAEIMQHAAEAEDDATVKECLGTLNRQHARVTELVRDELGRKQSSSLAPPPT